LSQYKHLIDEGFSMPLNDALAWEEQRGIESAREASAALIASRRDDVLARGRDDKEDRG
jgi:enoyl-CoA hydratase